jgi:hypothetical protein
MEDGIEQYMPLLPKIVKPVTTIVTSTIIKQEQKTEKLILVDQSIPPITKPIKKPITPPFSWQRDH